MSQPSRRQFLHTATVATAGAALTASASLGAGFHPGGSDEIRVGLIGCGGRGTGAAVDVCKAAEGVKIVALGDVFPNRVQKCHERLAKELGEKFTVADEAHFTGFDAYQKVVDRPDVNYVILATPPGFRAVHLEAAVTAGKNIFTEKPVAVDAEGIRRCLKAYEEAKAKNLGIVAGTQRRHQTGYLETIKRVKDGAIGKIVSARCYWNQGSLWHVKQESGWSDMEWQLRNWLYFTWLSGDHIVEQHVHNLDVINWVLDATPARAVGMGGRQVRVEPEFGHIFDHFAVEYEYPNGVHLLSECRQIDGCEGNVSEVLVGTKGVCQVNRYRITGETNWSFDRKKDNLPYVQEHTDLIASIRAKQPLNELQNVAHSTLTAIMGRMSAYTGKALTWDKALKSRESLLPPKLEMGSLPVPPVAMPGRTQLV
jgi:myo-inositol 2-dehydrogenase / D-chiro-inositol 1-dehydrogenase